MPVKSKIQLIPWDPESPAHVERMIIQRERCGWDFEYVPVHWKEDQIAGKKCLYWIASLPEDPEHDSILNIQLSTSPKEQEAIEDTATHLRGTPRTPTSASFHPIGHISLSTWNPVTRGIDLDLPEKDLYFVKSLYVTPTLQSKGIGRAAMDLVESMVKEAPLNAKTLALDTMHKDSQRRGWREQSDPQWESKLTNHEWYERRGYRLIKTASNLYDDTRGHHDVVFLRKDL